MLSTLAIIGVGLIGGSLGLAARKYHAARRVIGIGRNSKTLAAALKKGAVDDISTDLAAVSQADVVVICTPVETIPALVQDIALHAQTGTIITDAGSTKEQIVRDAEKTLKRLKASVNFIGGHPMAGSEKTSVEFARADLFQNRAVMLTPTKNTNPESLEILQVFWQTVGGRIHLCTPNEHDALVAGTSHVPHLIASALAAATPADSLPFVAGGWLDTTRIAAGDPELWRQILSQNRGHVLKSLARFEKVLHAVRVSLEQESDAKLLPILEAGKRTRDSMGS